jgi:hypothetical protein
LDDDDDDDDDDRFVFDAFCDASAAHSYLCSVYQSRRWQSAEQ